MRVRRDPLRGNRGPDRDVQLSLPRLSENVRRTLHSRLLRAGERIKITKGTPKYYSTGSEMMGDNIRGFCPECGSRLFGGKTDFGQGIAAGTLDDPSLYKPQQEMWISDTQPWDAMDAELPRFEKYVPRG